MKDNEKQNYYTIIKHQMMKEFNAMYKGTRKILAQYFDESMIENLQNESKREYINLFPQLPYIGGKKNKQTINLIMGAIIIAIVRPLEKEGLSKHQIGKIIYVTFHLYFQAKPRLLLFLVRKLILSGFYIKKMKKQIENTFQRKYKEDFVIENVESNGKDYDFGYNYTECALHKLYIKHDAVKYLPYVCLGDYPMFQFLGIGFNRSQTIANGAPHCDFRFKKNGKTPIAWPPENLEEWKEE